MMHKYFEINERGNNIRCKLYYKDKGAPDNAVIFCTGFAGHKDNSSAEKFAEKVLSKCKNTVIVVFNWPAHGDDVKKKLTLNYCDTYLQLVIEHVKNDIGAMRLYAYASSFGGYLVLKYVHEHGDPFEKMALRCPAVSMYDIITGSIMKNDEYARIMKGKDVLVGFDRKVVVTAALLEDLKNNDVRNWDYLDYADTILILHGTSDEVVPYSISRQFAEDNVIEFKTFEGADHRFQNPVHMSLATKYVMEFFEL